MRISRLLAGLIALGAATSTTVMAQDTAPAPQAAPAPAAPPAVTDTKPVGDWTVRCFAVASASPCDMYAEYHQDTSQQRVLSVSIAYVPKDDRHVVDIAVPLGISIAAGVVIKTDSYTSPKLGFRRCDQAGCYVEGLMPNDMVAAIAKSGPNASVNIMADDGKPFSIRLSLNGFAGAHDAMAQMAKEKAKNTDAAAAAPKKK
ncbi:MAG TPA: invasion associated locus B family protein [Rhizomicrobium sp.]|jgi:invasion protein IalB|nr:invasion associated locus B family protein [Rhizomicrobium sp.]